MIVAVVTGAGVEQGTPPELLNLPYVLKHQNYPAEAARRGEYGIVSIAVHISADGRVMGCDVTEISGSTALDKGTCPMFGRRARFSPARDAAGFAVPGDYRVAIAWGVERTALELSLLVPSLPPGYRSPAKARLLFDAAGKLASCEIITTSGNVAADRTICAQMRKQPVSIAAPRSIAADVPAVAVRYLTAAFYTKEDAAPLPK